MEDENSSSGAEKNTDNQPPCAGDKSDTGGQSPGSGPEDTLRDGKPSYTGSCFHLIMVLLDKRSPSKIDSPEQDVSESGSVITVQPSQSSGNPKQANKATGKGEVSLLLRMVLLLTFILL